MKLRLLTTAIAIVGLAGCNLSKQSDPGLTGPSTLGRSVVLSASPDRILYDGSAVTEITATVRNASGKPEDKVALRWEAAVVQIVNGTRTVTSIPVEPVPQITTTGSNGQAKSVVRAPIAPDVMPAGITVLEVVAIPIGDDASQLAPGIDAKPRFIAIELVPQTGSAAPDRLPVVDFTISPSVATINQTVTLDGSLTRDEGVVCGDRCTYLWDFGATAATKTGRVVTLVFPTSGTVNVRLTVTDDKGFSSSASKSLVVTAPAAPVARFFVIPAQPQVGNAASFDASASTVGTGASIVSYVWDFGENGAKDTGKTVSYAYTGAGAKTVTLTVSDDLGRTHQTTLALTVIP